MFAAVGLAAASVAVVLLALEGVFRVFGIAGDYSVPRVDRVIVRRGAPMQRIPHGFIPYATFRSRYASNPRGYFDADNTVDHVHNSLGWRDVEHAIAKPPGNFRVLGLGDSYLWGQGVHREDIVLTKLGQRLAAVAPNRTIETINAARSGSNTVGQLASLNQRGLAFDPDLVILHFVPNDVEESPDDPRPKIDFFRDYTAIYQTPDRLSEFSNLWSWVRQRFLAWFRARAYVRDSVASFDVSSSKWQTARRALLGMRDALRDRDIPLLVVIFPFFHDLDGDYPFAPIHDVVREFCESNDIAVLDLRESYRGYRGPELWVHSTDQHPNERAHAIAAKAVFEYLDAHPELLGAL
jgi:hypothetical protein